MNGPDPVVIVGAGPVGLTMALSLARLGIPSDVLEEREAVCDGSRALGLSRRTLEIWHAVAAAEPIARRGLPWLGGQTFYRERPILAFHMPDDARLRYRPMLNLQQDLTERFLRDAVQAQSSLIRLRLQHRVETIERQAHGVVVGVQTPQGPAHFSAPYVVACDGARSSVRSLLGLRLEGTSYEAAYVIADIRMNSDAPMGRRCWFDPPSNPGLTVLMHRQPDNVWRLDYQLETGEDVETALDPDRVKARIQQHLDYIGEQSPWTLEWSSVYRVHSRALQDFRHERVFFAGDAAHLMPIFGIRGLNSGIEDAWNLAWKLALVHGGHAEGGLLDTYSAERRAIFLENTALAERNACFMTPPNAGTRLARDAVLRLALSTDAFADVINPKQASYVPIRVSPILCPDTDGFQAGPAPGEVVPDVRLHGDPQGAEFLLDRLGPGFTLMIFTGPGAADVPAWTRAFTALPACVQVLCVSTDEAAPGAGALRDPQGDLHRCFDADAGTAYLVRPDHNVLLRLRRFDARRIEAALTACLAGGLRAQEVPPPRIELTHAETVFRAIGQALDASAAQDREAFLTRFALLAALQLAPADLERLLKVASSQQDPAT